MRGIGARFVSVLESDTDPGRHYTGVTSDVDNRLEWHNHGPSGYTLNCRLREDGEAVGEKHVRRLMREEQIRGRIPKRFTQTTNSDHQDPVAANLLDRDFTAAAPTNAGSATRPSS